MAKTDKNIVNIGKLYDILSQIKTKISSRFSAIDTAIAGKKASGASSISNSSNLKTLKKLEFDTDGKIVSGTGHTEFQDIGIASTPSAGGVGSSAGILKLQDKLDSSRENAVTPNAVKQALDALEPWGVNLNARVTSIDHSRPDPNPSIQYDYLIDNLQNYKNNVVTLTRHDNSYNCHKGIKIIPPTISNPNDIYKYNFWIRLTTTTPLTEDMIKSSEPFTIEIDGVGFILDQYDLSVNHTSSNLSTRRIKTTKITDIAADYKLDVQTIGPGATPDANRFNQFSSVLDVVVDRQEEYTANDAKEIYKPTLDYVDDVKLNNDYGVGNHTNKILFPSAIRNSVTGEIYCIPYHYLIKVTGDVLKIYRLQPPA